MGLYYPAISLFKECEVRCNYTFMHDKWINIQLVPGNLLLLFSYLFGEGVAQLLFEIFSRWYA